MTKTTTADLTPKDDRPPAPPAESDRVTDGVTDGASNETTAPAEAPQVNEAQVRRILRQIGRGVHRAIGHDQIPEHWAFTDDELDDLTPPATALANRNALLAGAVERSDAAAVAVILFGWTMRNVDLSQQIAEAEAQIAEEDAQAATFDQAAPPTRTDPGSAQIGALDTLTRKETP